VSDMPSRKGLGSCVSTCHWPVSHLFDLIRFHSAAVRGADDTEEEEEYLPMWTTGLNGTRSG
jgi:hypothetical protein